MNENIGSGYRKARKEQRMTDKTTNKATGTADRRPDCVTEVRIGNSVLVVSGFFKKDATATAADKMMKVLEAESVARHDDNPRITE